MKFGVHTGLQNTSINELQSLWLRIEDLGFDWISIWDHFYAADGTGNPHCLEAVASHAALAATTSRVRCGSLVYSVGYRHPAVLANAAATLDQLSGGRITLGLGGGWLADEYQAYGIEFPPVGVRLRQVEEAIQCVRGLLTEDVTSFDGEYFTLTEARCEPKPVQERLPLWIGGGGEKVTMRTAARHADGWNVPFISPEDYARKVGVLEQHCEAAERDPAEVTRSVNVGVAFTEDALKAQFGNIADYVRPGVLTGSVDEMIDRVGQYRDAGAEWLILAMRAPFD
ncbi:MAG: TIGR03560 family F420-dependent LLM class oxidoreductase, partial [Acidimicrobiia bacterium]